MNFQPFLTTEFTFEALVDKAHSEMCEAERSAEKAVRRRARLKPQIQQELAQRYLREPTDMELTTVLDKRCGSDPYWKSKAGSNRWHVDQATMYGTLAMVAAEQERRDRLEERESSGDDFRPGGVRIPDND